jgi:hypothetical protein
MWTLRTAALYMQVKIICTIHWVSSTNKTDCHDITEILWKVALNTINLIKKTAFVPVIKISETSFNYTFVLYLQETLYFFPNYTGSHQSNYHIITTTMASLLVYRLSFNIIYHYCFLLSFHCKIEALGRVGTFEQYEPLVWETSKERMDTIICRYLVLH